MIKKILNIFGSQNDRILKKYSKKVKQINKLEPHYESLSDDELKSAFNALRDEVRSQKKELDEALVDSFAITREVSKRVLGMRHFDVQLVGGMVLHDSNIAEMKTGEGKTLVATLAVVLNAMTNQGVHIVTVNDYLASRDATQMGVLYEFLGYSVGCITSNMRDESIKKAQYDADITYGTNNEYGFDYLRDNMKIRASQKVQRGHNFAIVDEVDSILIDEARTPLIISGAVQRETQDYFKANQVALKLIKGERHDIREVMKSQNPNPELVKIIEALKNDMQSSTQKYIMTGDFIVDEKDRTIIMTEEGLQKAQDLFEVDNLYSLENAKLSHHLDQALKAHYLFEKDVQYVVREGEVIIVDEFTGRLSEGRRYSEGLY
jgi:preprotein translocase subunit SecA